METIKILEITKLENFRQGLKDATNCVTELGGRIALDRIKTYGELEEYEVMEILQEEFGFDPENQDLIVNKYTISETPNSPEKEKIKVTIFRTNYPEIFIGKYEYEKNGEIVWELKPPENLM